MAVAWRSHGGRMRRALLPPYTHALLHAEMKLTKYGGKRNVPMGSLGGGPDRYDTMKGESEKVLSRQDDGRKFL